MAKVEQRKTRSLDFSSALLLEIIKHIYNFYGIDNWDVERFGKYKRRLILSIFTALNVLLNKLGFCLLYPKEEILRTERLIHDFGDGLSHLYELLENDYSKDILIKVIAYRILGFRKMKLPLNTEDYWEKRRKAHFLIKNNNRIDIDFMKWSLNYFELDDIGYPIKLFARPLNIAHTYMQHQYTYSKIRSIAVQNDDYVIDAGSCWGDTALSFAFDAGPNGRVYSFEFVPENLKILKRNIELNPELKNRIEIIRNPLWRSSNLTLSYSEKGPASSVITSEEIKEPDCRIVTLSIDDFVENSNLPKLDFIKMDIEGGELQALEGAKNTIRKYRPKLAISIYHSLEDFVNIPKYIESLDANFRYYLDHYTIHNEETVLFAVPKDC